MSTPKPLSRAARKPPQATITATTTAPNAATIAGMTMPTITRCPTRAAST